MSIDRDFEQVSEEHMKSMTKGPAQEPATVEQVRDAIAHGGDHRDIINRPEPVPAATPAPSQPAGAREYFIAELGRKPTGPMDNGYIRFANAYAAQQAASKDAALQTVFADGAFFTLSSDTQDAVRAALKAGKESHG